MINQDKLDALKNRMDKLGIQEKDLIIKYILGSGSGGQKVNKSHSAVYVKHLPTGTEVKCQKTRHRSLNHYYAHMLLCEKLEKEILGEKTEREKLAEKVRRQKKRRSRRSKENMLEEKRQHSDKKQLRQSPEQ